MTNEELYQDLSVKLREGKYGNSIAYRRFMKLVSIDSFSNDLMNLARQDEVKRLEKAMQGKVVTKLNEVGNDK